MTREEKAATFLGWKPGRACPGDWEECEHHAFRHFENRGAAGVYKWIEPHDIPYPDIADNFVEAARKAYLDLFVEGDPRLTAFQRGGLMYAIEMVLDENSAEPLINFLAQMYDGAT